ncbi:hypothetical protein Bbelb_055740 [Branchiostoma belcheri]|nr:hypothetical protein Bbelb_055740 [Branchiostoma belcheri]
MKTFDVSQTAARPAGQRQPSPSSSQEPPVSKMSDVWTRLLQVVCMFGVVSTLAGVSILSAQVSKVRQEQARVRKEQARVREEQARVSTELSRLEDEVVAALEATVAAVQAQQAGDVLVLRTNLSSLHAEQLHNYRVLDNKNNESALYACIEIWSFVELQVPTARVTAGSLLFLTSMDYPGLQPGQNLGGQTAQSLWMQISYVEDLTRQAYDMYP